MSFPTPPPDNSGGFIVIKYTDGSAVHRLRFHVQPFAADSVGTYVSVPSGYEPTVQNTAAQLMNRLKPDFKTTWTMSLDAVYQVSGGVVTQIFTITPPSTVAGTNGGSVPIAELFTAFNFRTQAGGHARFFRFAMVGTEVGAASTVVGADTSSGPQLVLYLTGGLPTGTANKTQIVGHDGSVLIGAAHVTTGYNRKARRRAGDA